MAQGNNKGKQLMSFQNYIRTLSNNIDEQSACKKYKDFIVSLSQSKVGRFFDTNKDREWFRHKYHPIESQKMINKQAAFYLKRLKIFNDLNDRNFFDSLTYTTQDASRILNLMDAIIIQLDDGPKEFIEQLLSSSDTEHDLELRQKYIPNKSTSVVIDDLSIETTLLEIQEICQQVNSNILRVAELDPYYVKGGHLRRKFVVMYEPSVDIKDVCWKLSRHKLNNKALNVSINKCLSERIIPINPISNHYLSIVNDIRNAIILILNFDEHKGFHANKKQLDNNVNHDQSVRMEVYDNDENNVDKIDNVAPLSPPGSEKSVKEEDEEKPFDVSTLDEEQEKEKRKLYEFKFETTLSLHRQIIALNQSKNPILEGAYLYLIEYIESSAASYYVSRIPKELRISDNQQGEDLLDMNQTDKFSTIELIVKNLDRSLQQSTKYLDKLLWYLRIVHSFDYYKNAIYRKEDELTYKMGVIHLRDNPNNIPDDISMEELKNYIQKVNKGFETFSQSLGQRYVSKDEERFNYRSYGKVITDELTSYAQRIQKQKSNETEEVYKCKHCSRVFQKLSDIGRHFVGKHRWAVDAIELETDFFNAYLFDCNKIDPCPPKELVDVPPNRFAKLDNFNHVDEDSDLLQQTVEAYNKMETFVREPAPRVQVDSDPRNESIVDYTDISFDDAI